MARNKTRRKHIIRRRIMRAMAAITMIMAVAIASIPVENFGTMRAAEEIDALAVQDVFDMDEEYQKYLKSHSDTGTEGDASVQRIDGDGNVKDAYKVKLGADETAVISGMTDANADAVTINETEYYNFVMFAENDISKLESILSADEERAKYELVPGKYNGNDVYLPRLKEEYASEVPIEERYISGGKATIVGIGKSAFKGAKLASIEIPASVKKIDDYCFMGNDNLTDVIFKDGGDASVEIGAYAFYNCPSLKTVKFSDGTKYKIGEGAFALDKGHSDKNEFEFAFPKANDKVDSDYILAGRRQLALVKFSENIGGTIPANTLRGCYGIRTAVFETADAGYDTSRPKEEQLFADVANPYFMVEGPAFKPGSDQSQEAEPKKSSAKSVYANFEDSAGNSSWKSVPYKYTGKDGNNYIDIGYEEGKCVATISVEENSTNATLVKYFAAGLSNRIAVTIPQNAGNYTITKIGTGCFDGEGNEVKSRIYELTIEDFGSLAEIGEGAFRGCPNLEWVNIGNSVEAIGANAFAQCPRLQNVKFSRNGSKLGHLGDSAFDTSGNGAPYLTFYGDIKSGYAPFDFAMSNRKTKQGAHICYKTGVPENLTVIWNDEANAVTLVDYPHYDEIDSINSNYINKKHGSRYSIQTAFEAGNLADMTDVDVAIVNAAFDINLPNEIKSIDTASFFGNDPKYKKNIEDNFYLQKRYVFDESKLNGSDPAYKAEDISNERSGIIAKYSENGDAGIAKGRSTADYDLYYAKDYDDKNVSRGGLFSGYFAEQGDKEKAKPGMITREYNGITHGQDYTSGNDNITSVSMPGVTELPDYAFDSCENLRTAAFGPALEKIGLLPFRNVKKLDSVNFNGNAKYAFEGKVLYENEGAGYKIIEMLESRTGDFGTDDFKPLGKVTGIAQGAFSNNEFIGRINLSSTEIKEIPADCFKNSVNLGLISLPPTVKRIEADALKNVKDGIIIEIPTGDCVIAADAADGATAVKIIGKEKDDEGNLTELGKSVKNLKNVTFVENPPSGDISGGNTPSESKPSESKPSESKPSKKESRANESSESKPSESKPSESKPSESKPSESRPSESKPSESKPSESRPSESKPSESKPSESKPSESKPSEGKYKVKVNGGVISGNGGNSGEGEFAAGTSVEITASTPDSTSKVFSRWSSNNANVVFRSATSSKTSFIMPVPESGSEIIVTANYTARTDEDDSSASSRRSGTTTTITTATAADTAQNAQTTSASTTTTTTTVTTTSNTAGAADNNGNRIYITKNGISNQDAASVAVDGSTDNFIARISESDEAAAAAGQALINTYGSLDGIAYFPMDISLYDVSGQNKITDTYGLGVTVTVPIPDVLIQYGGNARVAACDNGNLQQLTPRFTTIDGIACISFVPPHFSPYVIYVDTNNLTAGQTLDQTPKTGDPLHPKWFLAMGMACLSVVLFAASDGRRRRKIKAV